MKKQKKQVGFLIEVKLLRQLKKEAIDRDTNLANYIRSILKNRKNINFKGEKNGDNMS